MHTFGFQQLPPSLSKRPMPLPAAATLAFLPLLSLPRQCLFQHPPNLPCLSKHPNLTSLPVQHCLLCATLSCAQAPLDPPHRLPTTSSTRRLLPFTDASLACLGSFVSSPATSMATRPARRASTSGASNSLQIQIQRRMRSGKRWTAMSPPTWLRSMRMLNCTSAAPAHPHQRTSASPLSSSSPTPSHRQRPS